MFCSKSAVSILRNLHLSKVFLCSKNRPVEMSYTLFETSVTNETLPPLIIMHGLFGSRQNWRGVSRALEAKLNRRIYSVDARNHGDSPHTMEHGFPAMAADVIEFMHIHNISKASLMGHSMGGRAMMYVALKYPEHVDRGIIIDISPVSIPGNFFRIEEIFNAMKHILIPPQLSLSQGRLLAREQMKVAVSNYENLDFILMNLRKRENGEFYWAPNLDALQKNLRHFRTFLEYVEGVPPFAGPMMFIGGTKSNFINPTDWPTIQSIFPNSILNWLNTGHLVHFEEPVRFIDVVVNFLKT